MVKTGSNLVKVGSFNQTVILDAIRRSDGISRIELAQRTNLVPQTVTNICRRLLAEGLIVEAGKTSGSMGKPRTILRMRPEGRFVVGVLLDPAQITVVLLDLTGVIRARQSLPTPPPDNPERVIATIAEQVAHIVRDGSVDRDRLLGVGVAAPGPIDLAAGAIDSPPHLPGWDRVPLRGELEAATGLPVVLDKDVVAAVVAETWRGSSRPREALGLLYVGTGIGVGVSINGEVVRGSSGNAGEVGHIVVDPDGPRCYCGLRGCVAVTSAPGALVERLYGRVPAADIGRALERIVAGPLTAKSADVVGAALDGVARLTLVVADLYDLDRVVFGGPFWQYLRQLFSERALPMLREAPVAHRIHGVEMEHSALEEDLGAVGAGSLVLDRFLSPRTSSLTLTADRT